MIIDFLFSDRTIISIRQGRLNANYLSINFMQYFHRTFFSPTQLECIPPLVVHHIWLKEKNVTSHVRFQIRIRKPNGFFSFSFKRLSVRFQVILPTGRQWRPMHQNCLTCCERKEHNVFIIVISVQQPYGSVSTCPFICTFLFTDTF